MEGYICLLFIYLYIIFGSIIPLGYRFPDFENYSFARMSCAVVPIRLVHFIFVFRECAISYFLVSNGMLDLYLLF